MTPQELFALPEGTHLVTDGYCQLRLDKSMRYPDKAPPYQHSMVWDVNSERPDTSHVWLPSFSIIMYTNRKFKIRVMVGTVYITAANPRDILKKLSLVPPQS